MDAFNLEVAASPESRSYSAPCSPAAASSGYSSPGPISTATLERWPSFPEHENMELTSNSRPDVNPFVIPNSCCSSPFLESQSLNLESPEYCPQGYIDDLMFPIVPTEPNHCFSANSQFTPSGGPENLLENHDRVYGPEFFLNCPRSIETVEQLLKFCKICGDMASGKHFGVQSCEACKSFFRRSVRSNSHYACRGSHNCTVDKRTRNRCQYCRLQKCLSSGMRKEAIREERSGIAAPTTGSLEELVTSKKNKFELNCSPDSTVSDAVLMNADKGLQSDESAMVTSPTIKSDEVQSENLKNSLLKVIDWAKRIPAFVTFSHEDQVTLLNSCWHEVFTFMQASRDSASIELERWISNLGADKVELACLKGVLLFNQDAKGLSLASKKRVETFQNQILQSLETRTKTVYGDSPLRFFKLLLRLGSLKSISTEALNDQVALENRKIMALLRELL